MENQAPKRSYPAMTKKQIAAKYNISTATLTEWIEFAELKFRRGIFTPKDVQRIVDAFDPWQEDEK